MNTPKCSDINSINFLVASPRAVSGTEAALVHPAQSDPPAHDAFTRPLPRLEPDPLWHESAPLVRARARHLVGDDSTLDKPYAAKIALLTHHWSGKHHAVVDGINLITRLCTEGESLIP